MRKLKNLIRSPYLPLQQCINRIIKLQKCSSNESHIDTNNTSENVIDQSDDIQLKILKHNNFTIKLNGKDNCLLLKDKIWNKSSISDKLLSNVLNNTSILLIMPS